MYLAATVKDDYITLHVGALKQTVECEQGDNTIKYQDDNRVVTIFVINRDSLLLDAIGQDVYLRRIRKNEKDQFYYSDNGELVDESTDNQVRK